MFPRAIKAAGVHLKTIRQKVLVSASSAAALAGASLCALHSGVVRRFALGRIQALLENTHGIILEAGGLNYNLFQSHYELEDVVLHGNGLKDLPAPVRAKHVRLAVSLWDLLHGSFNRAHVHIDGLSVHLVSDAMGRRNLLNPRASGGSAQPRGPAFTISNAAISVEDEPAGFSIQLPVDRAWGAWNAWNRVYGIAIEASSGFVQWRSLRVPVDRLQLNSAIAGDRFSVESLRITSGDSTAEITGAFNGPPATIQATASLDVDSNYIGQALALKLRLAGRMRAQVMATGPLDGFRLAGDLRLPQLNIGKIVLQCPALDFEFDTATGELRIRSLSVGLLSGMCSESDSRYDSLYLATKSKVPKS